MELEASVCPFHFSARSRISSDSWRREGAGNARWVLDPVQGELRVEEVGHWWDLPEVDGLVPVSKIGFRRGFRIVRNARSLQILKALGDGSEVFLVDLEPGGTAGSWDSCSDHLCGDDRYRARLDLTGGDAVRIGWTTFGPRKDYETWTEYTAAGKWIRWFDAIATGLPCQGMDREGVRG